jgi:hypothetical protein
MQLIHSYRMTLYLQFRQRINAIDRTSMQGVSQAIEDGVVLAVTLQLAGKAKVPLALRAWETIRLNQLYPNYG